MLDTSHPLMTQPVKRRAGRPPNKPSVTSHVAATLDVASVDAALMLQVDALVNVEKVSLLTTLSAGEINRRVSEKRFPPPMQIGAMRKAWHISTIQSWLQNPTY